MQWRDYFCLAISASMHIRIIDDCYNKRCWRGRQATWTSSRTRRLRCRTIPETILLAKKLKKWVVRCREMVKLLTSHAQVKHKAFHLVKRRLDQIFESIQCRSEDEKKLLRQLVFFDGKVSCLHGSGTNVEFSHQSLKTHVLHFVGAGIVVCTNQCCHKHQFALQIVRLVPRRIVFWRNWRWHACCSAQRCSVPIERR